MLPGKSQTSRARPYHCRFSRLLSPKIANGDRSEKGDGNEDPRLHSHACRRYRGRPQEPLGVYDMGISVPGYEAAN
jgi:hypothetical protein